MPPAVMLRSAALTLCALAAPGTAAPKSPPRLPPARLERLSRAYLGTPYHLDALGEGVPPDRDPTFTRRWVDCQTLVEQVMIEALAPTLGGIGPAGQAVRYGGRAARLENRLHYCIPDWLSAPWPARDLTRELAGSDARSARRRIDLPAYIRRRHGDPRRSPHPARWIGFSYVPRAAVPRLPAARLDGTIAVWVIDRPGIIAGHVGFLFRNHGSVVFRHASQRRGQVIDQPLPAYLKLAPRNVLGLIVLEPYLPSR